MSDEQRKPVAFTRSYGSQDPSEPKEVKKYRMKCDSYLLSADFFTLTHKIVQPLRLAVKVIPAVLNQIQEEGESVQ